MTWNQTQLTMEKDFIKERDRLKVINLSLEAIETLALGADDNIDEDYTDAMNNLLWQVKAASYIADRCIDKLRYLMDKIEED